MDRAEIESLVARCTHFLRGHYPRTVPQQLEEIASSPLALKKSDNYGNGGFLSEFELEVAGLLGKEAAVFMPSGTIAQQIALRIWADRAGNKRIAFHPTCHLEIHEQMAYRELHHLEATLVGESSRLFTLADLQGAAPVSTLLIELPQREIGGQLPGWEDLQNICRFAQDSGWKLHLDGARLWECAPYYARSYAEIVGPFDSVYVSFYKILNGMPAALLAGPADFVSEARIWLRRHGGNLQQMSAAAISAKLGMDRHLPRMGDYVGKAQEIARILGEFEEVTVVPSLPPTNMMHLYFRPAAEDLVQAAMEIAREDKLFLFSMLSATERGAKAEINIGEAALDLREDQIRSAFAKLFEKATVRA